MVAAHPIGQNSHRQLRRAAPGVAPGEASRTVIHDVQAQRQRRHSLTGVTDEDGARVPIVKTVVRFVPVWKYHRSQNFELDPMAWESPPPRPTTVHHGIQALHHQGCKLSGSQDQQPDLIDGHAVHPQQPTSPQLLPATPIRAVDRNLDKETSLFLPSGIDAHTNRKR